MDKVLENIYKLHDITCNQQYGDKLPYSFHLKAVVAQVRKYYGIFWVQSKLSLPEKSDIFTILMIAGAGHDLIEDARQTYNDVISLCTGISKNNSEIIADIIYCCTEEKGKNRTERHSDKFFLELSQNRLAVFVKLCDIMANALYSKLTDSTMFYKYRSEFSYLKEKLYIKGEYDQLWEDLEQTLS